MFSFVGESKHSSERKNVIMLKIILKQNFPVMCKGEKIVILLF